MSVQSKSTRKLEANHRDLWWFCWCCWWFSLIFWWFGSQPSHPKWRPTTQPPAPDSCARTCRSPWLTTWTQWGSIGGYKGRSWPKFGVKGVASVGCFYDEQNMKKIYCSKTYVSIFGPKFIPSRHCRACKVSPYLGQSMLHPLKTHSICDIDYCHAIPVQAHFYARCSNRVTAFHPEDK